MSFGRAPTIPKLANLYPLNTGQHELDKTAHLFVFKVITVHIITIPSHDIFTKKYFSYLAKCTVSFSLLNNKNITCSKLTFSRKLTISEHKNLMVQTSGHTCNQVAPTLAKLKCEISPYSGRVLPCNCPLLH